MNFKSLNLLVFLNKLLFFVTCTILASPQENYDFVLLINHYEQHYMAKFPLNDLKKCQFPEGPLRANIPCVEDFELIDEDLYNKLHNDSLKLQVFCIEDGVCYKNFNNDESITLKKCGFEVPGQSKLHYVFCIKEEMKNISGHIVLRSELDTLQKKDKDNELSFEAQIDDPEWELRAEKKIEDLNVPLRIKIGNYCRLLAAVIYIQYLKFTDYLGLSSDLKQLIKPKDELSKFKPTYIQEVEQ